MVAPPIAAASSGLPPPSPTEKPLPISEPIPTEISFPNEFPYEFDSSAFTSPGDSTETEGETTDDEDDFLARLTRRLALSTQRLSSPPSFVTDESDKVKPTESTQSGLGSPNGPFSQAPSPPTSPFINQNPNSLIPFPPPFYDYSYYYWLWQSQIIYNHYQSQIRFDSTTLQPGLLANPYLVNGVFAAPNAVKPASTGTGVFLPRSDPNPSDSKKKSRSRCDKLPTKKAVHSKTEEVNHVGGGCLKEEKHLPQEWMY